MGFRRSWFTPKRDEQPEEQHQDEHEIAAAAKARSLPDLPWMPQGEERNPDRWLPWQQDDDSDSASLADNADAPLAPPIPNPMPEPAPLRIGTPERPLRIGVIGAGFGAAVHVPAFANLPETEIVGVCARRTEKAIAAGAPYRVPLVTTDFRELIAESSIEAIVVATPPFLHHSMVIAALQAGKHVLCEKPMAKTLAEAKDMAKMAEANGVVAMVNHQFRFQPARIRIKQLIDEGYIGTPQAATLTAFRSTLNDPYDKPHGWLMESEKGGGMLGATGSHHVDALRWWFGDISGVAGTTATMVPRRVTMDGSGLGKVDADDNFAFVLRFASGALGTVHVTTTSGVESGEEIILSGSEGMIICQGDGSLYGSRKGQPGLNAIDLPDDLNEGLDEFEHPLIRPTMLLARRWVAAIRDGTPSPSPSFADGVKIQEILEGVVRSGQQGRWMDTSGQRFPTAISRLTTG